MCGGGGRAPRRTGAGIREAVSNQVTLCSGLAVAGSFKSGRGLSGTGIGALTSIAFTGCKVEGVAVTVTVRTSAANPAPINLTQEFPVGSTVFTGQATNISITLDDAAAATPSWAPRSSLAAAPASPAWPTAAPTTGSRSPRAARACSSSPRRLNATTGPPAWT
jgi:hypothetical protein